MLLSIEMRYLLFELYKTRKNKRFIEVSIIIYHFLISLKIVKRQYNILRYYY